MIITKNFHNFVIVDEKNKLVLAPQGSMLDYADDDLGIVSFKNIETVSANLINPYDKTEYTISTPVSYQVLNCKIQIIRK